MNIIGREPELNILNAMLKDDKPEFVAIYGRRRVGKTFLIREFFKNKGFYFEITGIKDANKAIQLKNFCHIFAEVFQQDQILSIPKDWHDAFYLLKQQIEKISTTQKLIFFFDELPWLATRKSNFLEALDYFWNRYMSARPNTILVICGSAAEWMIKKIISNKSGLHNRLTRPAIHLQPFNLHQTEKYLQELGIFLDRKQIIDLYMALGGVAYYLNLIPKGKSSTEVISYLFFSKQAPLAQEFRNLFNSLYETPYRHLEVLKVMAKSRHGFSQSQLFQKLKTISSGGTAVGILEELEHCGFITKILDFGKKKKDARYRLIDPYTLFYLKWMSSANEYPDLYWQRKKVSASYHAWSGYAFENICFMHYRQILKSLELSVVAEVKSSWQHHVDQNMDDKGTQIDLIIDRADRCINLCEIKFYEEPLSISKAYAEDLRYKKACFRRMTATKKTLFLTLISCYGLNSNSLHSNEIDSQVMMDDLFLA